MERKSRFNATRALPALLLATGLLAVPWQYAAAADPLGRLFTTPQQRKQLEELRHAQPQAELELVVADMPNPADTAPEEKPVADAITVKGLVTRKDGRSTAWINDSNTFEGDLSSQYLRIEAGDIRSQHVKITMPDRETAVTVKVGETYEPITGQYLDLATPAVPPPAMPGGGPGAPEPPAGAPPTQPPQP